MLKSIDVKQALIVTDVRNEIVEKTYNMPKVKAMAVDGSQCLRYSEPFSFDSHC